MDRAMNPAILAYRVLKAAGQVRLQTMIVATRQPVTLDGWEGNNEIRVLGSYTPTVGDAVLVIQSGGFAYVLGAVGTGGPPEEAVTPPGTSVVSDTTTVAAMATGTWRDGWRNDIVDVRQGADAAGTNHGYWFYGDQFGQFDGAVITAASLYLPATPTSPVGQTQLVRHDAPSQPGVEPTRSDPVQGPTLRPGEVNRWSGQWVLDTVTALIAGTRAGIGIDGAAPLILRGLTGNNRDPLTGALQITWERTG